MFYFSPYFQEPIQQVQCQVVLPADVQTNLNTLNALLDKLCQAPASCLKLLISILSSLVNVLLEALYLAVPSNTCLATILNLLLSLVNQLIAAVNCILQTVFALLQALQSSCCTTIIALVKQLILLLVQILSSVSALVTSLLAAIAVSNNYIYYSLSNIIREFCLIVFFLTFASFLDAAIKSNGTAGKSWKCCYIASAVCCCSTKYCSIVVEMCHRSDSLNRTRHQFTDMC